MGAGACQVTRPLPDRLRACLAFDLSLVGTGTDLVTLVGLIRSLSGYCGT